jgi:hypothetical protein
MDLRREREVRMKEFVSASNREKERERERKRGRERNRGIYTYIERE